MIARLICWINGHKRGKRLYASSMPADEFKGKNVFRCPRCGATWTRKAKAAA
jgi:hypothetical protein